MFIPSEYESAFSLSLTPHPPVFDLFILPCNKTAPFRQIRLMFNNVAREFNKSGRETALRQARVVMGAGDWLESAPYRRMRVRNFSSQVQQQEKSYCGECLKPQALPCIFTTVDVT